MDPENQAYNFNRDGPPVPSHSFSNTNPQNQFSQTYGHNSYQQAPPAYMPETGHQSNLGSTNKLYAGMTFCPGVDIPVARFLPRNGAVYNLMAEENHNSGATVKTNCPRCARPKQNHSGISKADWTQCPNPCFCHQQPLNNTLFCPLLYSSIGKLGRTFHWPGWAELPGYLRIFPTEAQQDILIDAGYITNRHSSKTIIPNFSQKAWALVGELDRLSNWNLGQPGYDQSIMSQQTIRTKSSSQQGQKRSLENTSHEGPSKSNIAPFQRQRAPIAFAPPALQINPGQPQAFQTNPGQPQAFQTNLGQPQAFQTNAGHPPAFQTNPGQPQAFQTNLGQPQAFQMNPGQPAAFGVNHEPNMQMDQGDHSHSLSHTERPTQLNSTSSGTPQIRLMDETGRSIATPISRRQRVLHNEAYRQDHAAETIQALRDENKQLKEKLDACKKEMRQHKEKMEEYKEKIISYETDYQHRNLRFPSERIPLVDRITSDSDTPSILDHSLSLSNRNGSRRESGQVTTQIPDYKASFDNLENLRMESGQVTTQMPDYKASFDNLENLRMEPGQVTTQMPDYKASFDNLENLRS